MSSPPKLGIICCDGPAPGLNGVIAAATIAACQEGWIVFGFHDGFLHLSSNNRAEVEANIFPLTIEHARTIAHTGGSILRTDRYDPTRQQEDVPSVLKMLNSFEIRYLLIIGGNHKITCTHLITQGVDPEEMQVIAVPKTIDNDIKLPPGQSTFGHHSAREFGVELVKNIICDCQSSPRWFCVETMGRRTGHLAFSIAAASGADLAIIPEDFNIAKLDISDICDVFEGAILKQLARGRDYGVCVICEGLISQMSAHSLKKLETHGYIHYSREGQIILDDCELSRAVVDEVMLRLKHLGIRITPKKLGYELRSCPPNDYDSVYSQELGDGAIQGFINHHSNCMVVWDGGVVSFPSFRSLMDPQSSRIVPRKVDAKSEPYKVSREYMSVIKRADLENEQMVQKMCELSKMSRVDFITKFGRLVSITN